MKSSVSSGNHYIGSVFAPLGLYATTANCCESCLRIESQRLLKEQDGLKKQLKWSIGIVAALTLWVAIALSGMIGTPNPILFLLPGIFAFFGLFWIGATVGALKRSTATTTSADAIEAHQRAFLVKTGLLQRKLADIARSVDLSMINLPIRVQGKEHVTDQGDLLFVEGEDWGTREWVDRQSTPRGKGLSVHSYFGRGRDTWYKTFSEPKGISCDPKRDTFALTRGSPPVGSGTVVTRHPDGCEFKDNPNRARIVRF